MDFWGDGNYLNGKLEEILDLINKDDGDIVVCMLPLQEKGKYGSPQLLLSEKPSDNCLNKIRESYRIRLFQNDDGGDDYKYLMTIETLRFNFEEDWHFGGFSGTDNSLSKSVTHNRWDFDGYFYITDEFNSYRRIAIIPFKRNTGIDSGHNLYRDDALRLVKSIVKRLNNGELLI